LTGIKKNWMDWIEEHALGQEARLLTMHKELHPRSDIDCISRNARRRGLLNIENIVNLAIIHYLEMLERQSQRRNMEKEITGEAATASNSVKLKRALCIYKNI
jgi:hypothetical protein